MVKLINPTPLTHDISYFKVGGIALKPLYLRFNHLRENSIIYTYYLYPTSPLTHDWGELITCTLNMWRRCYLSYNSELMILLLLIGLILLPFLFRIFAPLLFIALF
jgi:hypothetical protein